MIIQQSFKADFRVDMESDVVQDLDSDITISSTYKMTFYNVIYMPLSHEKRHPEVMVEGSSPPFSCVLYLRVLVISAGWIFFMSVFCGSLCTTFHTLYQPGQRDQMTCIINK